MKRFRPIDGHRQAGLDAYRDEANPEDNPWPEGSLAAAQWALGWRTGQAMDPLNYEFEAEVRAEGIPEDILRENAVHDAKVVSRRWIAEAQSRLPSAQEAADAIGVPLSEWPLNCHAISSAILASGLLEQFEAVYGKARVTYGVYTGYIDRDSIFAQGIARHGWIEFPAAGCVVDPTQWVFTRRNPELTVSSIDAYDLGSNLFKDRIRGDNKPRFASDEKLIHLDVNDPDVVAFVGRLLDDLPRLRDQGTLSLRQVVWLANRPPDILCQHGRTIFQFLERNGLQGMIPTDNYAWIMSDADLEEFPSPTPAPAMRRWT